MNRRMLLSVLPVLGCFAAAIWHMRHDWTYSETYHYGWTVAPLTAYLLFNRWKERPLTAAPAPSRWRFAGWCTVATLLILTWIIREANPDWRLAGVVLTGIAIAAAWLWLTEWGGRTARKHFGAAVAFFAIAIPWPSVLENAVAAALMPANAAIALEALHWLGVPALRQGNLIMLAEGTLGVEEACSGIRSLQATLMMALFLGEMHGLRRGARVGLIVAGWVAALLTNALRTTALSAIAAKEGLAAAERWHDNAGLVVLVANALILFTLAKILLKRHAAPPTPDDSEAPSKGPISLAGPLVCGSALLLLGPVVFLWYGLREQDPGPLWRMTPPEVAARFRFVPVDQRTAFMLRSSRGWSAKWNTPTGHPVHGFYFEWDPGRVPPENMNMHRPGGCLKNLGIDFDQEIAPLSVTVGTMTLTPRLIRFIDRGQALYVAYLVAGSEKERTGEVAFNFSYSRRLNAALHGIRNAGQRMVEIGIWGLPSEQAARQELTAMLEQQLLLKKP